MISPPGQVVVGLFISIFQIAYNDLKGVSTCDLSRSDRVGLNELQLTAIFGTLIFAKQSNRIGFPHFEYAE